jgi:hypothetical protein
MISRYLPGDMERIGEKLDHTFIFRSRDASHCTATVCILNVRSGHPLHVKAIFNKLRCYIFNIEKYYPTSSDFEAEVLATARQRSVFLMFVLLILGI